MRNAGLKETQAGIKIAGRNINNLRYADDKYFGFLLIYSPVCTSSYQTFVKQSFCARYSAGSVNAEKGRNLLLKTFLKQVSTVFSKIFPMEP